MSADLVRVFRQGGGLMCLLLAASCSQTPEPAAPAPPAKETAMAAPSKPDPSAKSDPAGMATAVVAGGCFWCTEAVFEELDGVQGVDSGYAGGTRESANYEAVCTGQTGHAEAIRITYDPARISYSRLLDVFFDAHDPTQLNRQGPDVGTQYRSAIFFANADEEKAAQAKIDELTKKGKFDSLIVTTLEPLVEFFPAEDYHQGYAAANPNQPYIRLQSYPKVCKIREKHAELLKK